MHEVYCLKGIIVAACFTRQVVIQLSTLLHLSMQDQHSGPSKKFEPPKRAQMIEPVLRHAPHRRAAPQTTAAYFRTAKAEPDAPDNKRPKLDYSASLPQPRQPSRSSPDDRQQDLYRQQIQDALREASPDSRADIATAQQQSAKRPTSRMAPPPRRGRPPSPALQDLSDRYNTQQTANTSDAAVIMCVPVLADISALG